MTDPNLLDTILERGSLTTLYQPVFDLATGACLDPQDGEPLALRTHPVQVRDGVVLVGREPGPGPVVP